MQVTPSQIAECWDVVSLGNNWKSLNEHSWTALRNEVLKLSEVVPPPEMTSSSSVVQVKRKEASSPTQQQSTLRPHSIVTPASKQTTMAAAASSLTGSGSRRISLSPKPPTFLQTESARKKAKYEERQGAGSVVSTLNANLAATGATAPLAKPRCRIAWNNTTTATTNNNNDQAIDELLAASNVQAPYRHMFTTVEHKARALEAHLNELSALFQTQYAFGQGDLAALEAVGVPRQEMVCCLGRICNSVGLGLERGLFSLLLFCFCF